MRRHFRWRMRQFKFLLDYFYMRYYGVDTHFGFVTLIGRPIIQRCPGSKIIIHKGVTLVSNSRGNVAGINHPVILATLSSKAIIEIDEDSGLSGSSLCSASSIFIGKHSGLGANSCIYDTDFHPLDPILRRENNSNNIKSYPVNIGEDVWIAANCLILKGVDIGNNAVVGAGSIVTRNVEENDIVAGNPARSIK